MLSGTALVASQGPPTLGAMSWKDSVVPAPRSANAFVQNIYAQFPGQPISFLDEAYRGFERPGEPPFYIFTAVIVEQRDMETIRKDLLEMAGSTYWHTSEALRTPDGRALAKDMLGYLMDGSEPCLVAKKVSIDPSDRSLEEARRTCFQALAVTLTLGVEGISPPVGVHVIEKRNTRELQKIDTRSHSDLIGSGAVPRTSRLVQASPSDDRLLWLPDVVSSAVRRSVAFGDNGMFDVVRDRIHFLPSSTL